MPLCAAARVSQNPPNPPMGARSPVSIFHLIAASIYLHESYDMVADAIQRETSLKRWPRKWRLELIEKSKPDWADLYESLRESLGGRVKPHRR